MMPVENCTRPTGMLGFPMAIRCIFAIASALWLGACSGSDGCVNTVQSSVTSPDGEHRAMVFQRGCGATTASSTQVTIAPAADSIPKGVGNVVVTRDALPATVTWDGSSRVVVRLDASSRIITKNEQADGVTIEYR